MASIHEIGGPWGLWWPLGRLATPPEPGGIALGIGLLGIGLEGQRGPVGVPAEFVGLEDPDVDLPEAAVLAPHGYPLLAECGVEVERLVHEYSILPLGVKVQGLWPLGRLSTQLSEAEVRGDPGPHHEGVEVDASVRADGPDVQVPHDVAGLLAGEAGEALGQLIDRGGHAREALGAAVGVLHESSIHEIGRARGALVDSPATGP
jgi:hypothetical protein